MAIVTDVPGRDVKKEISIDTSVREAAIFELCERLQPGIVQDVNIPYPMCDWGGCIIQVKKRNKIEERMRGWVEVLARTGQ